MKSPSSLQLLNSRRKKTAQKVDSFVVVAVTVEVYKLYIVHVADTIEVDIL